ncbi:rho-related GTP-binding protein RhoF isoform X1 [Hippocampus comes]|uniref:rho-related GTP-binding protein RhoF isoform X1 n=1 Tax=Hippocampus comes TaxID=109280 RepID=UPI00094E55E9|nr:PREDICTED: rho-related GTP-binding protein RhoF isoform X1 [Hippocampus comes]XP_019727730.1 PREDICTED: rho-related GTP-binding protein RhoF isoform X1 [Hippocampus comes]XP_019727731.1 PREDICTED: rho-related GTP-binding protein RhoF isoform X1 [Hippocampus comes]XP_019727732.1 PREDICTED: rho-related GTP-binding protein RhoF isoform X1 [Hippocampus comes]
MTQNKDAGGCNGSGGEGEELKIVIVGDGGCGKTSLLMVYAKDYFPEKYAPTVFEKYTTSVVLRGKEVKLTVCDTAGQEDYDRLRPLSYQQAHLILVCFDVTNPTSFDNVTIKWHPEVKHFCQDVPVILIGCKTDLRKDKECSRRLKAVNQAPVTYTQDAGHGRPGADERRALPGVFGQVPGERGRRVQGGHQEGFGLPPQAKPLQTQEELCPPMTATHFGWLVRRGFVLSLKLNLNVQIQPNCT